MATDRPTTVAPLRCGYFAECEQDADHDGPHTAGMYPEWTVPTIEPMAHIMPPSRAVELLRELVEALTEPLPDTQAATLNGTNSRWVDWYPKATIVNDAKGGDTGSVLIARIFDAVEKARAFLADSAAPAQEE